MSGSIDGEWGQLFEFARHRSFGGAAPHCSQSSSIQMTASHRCLGASPGVGSGHGKEERESQVTFPRPYPWEVAPRSPASSLFIGKYFFCSWISQEHTPCWLWVEYLCLLPLPTVDESSLILRPPSWLPNLDIQLHSGHTLEFKLGLLV